MRIVLTLLLIGHVTAHLFGQDDTNKENLVGFGCHLAGQPSLAVTRVTDMLKGRKYKDISGLLATGTAAEKYLAVVSLEKLSQLGQYALSEAERKLIAKIKISRDRVSVCSGCTYFKKISLKKMLSDHNFLGSDWWIEETLMGD